jgi:phospholipase D1/2
MIEAANHFIYIENQFFISRTAGKPVKNSISIALIERIKIAAVEKQKFRVIVVMPLLPGFEGKIDSSSILKAQMHWQYSTICRGILSIIKQLKKDKSIENIDDFISFYSLRTHALLNEIPVTEMIYVHSKLMIIDDKTVIIGSANINDRSLLGNRDSEIAVVITDKLKIDSIIDGLPVQVSKFAHSLRMHLFQEFTQCEDLSLLVDPLSEKFWNFWKTTAENNTFWYRHVFRCVPDNNVQKIDQLDEFERGGSLHEYQKLNENVKGFLVEFPLDFLKKESLKITIFNKEYLLPEENFV